MQIFCSICQENFHPHSNAVVITCGHIYHNSCIQQWLVQQKTCPQCRQHTKDIKPYRIYFNVECDVKLDPADLQNKLDSLSLKLHLKDAKLKELEEKVKDTEVKCKDLKDMVLKSEQEMCRSKESVMCLKEQIRNYRLDRENLTKVTSEYEELKSQVRNLENVEKIIKGTTETVKVVLARTDINPKSFKQLCTYVEVLKLELKKSDTKKQNLTNQNKMLENELSKIKKSKDKLEEKIEELNFLKTELEKENKKLKDSIKEATKRSHSSSIYSDVPFKKMKGNEFENQQPTCSNITTMQPSCSSVVNELLSASESISDISVNQNTVKVSKGPLVYKCSKAVVNYPKSSPYYRIPSDSSIFSKKAPTSNLCLQYKSSSFQQSSSSQFHYDGLGGSSRVPYKETPKEELVEARRKLAALKKKLSKPAVPVCKHTSSIKKFLEIIRE